MTWLLVIVILLNGHIDYVALHHSSSSADASEYCDGWKVFRDNEVPPMTKKNEVHCYLYRMKVDKSEFTYESFGELNGRDLGH